MDTLLEIGERGGRELTRQESARGFYFVDDLADAIFLDQLDALASLVWPAQVETTWARPDNWAS